jgi:hypothetical protein
VRSTCRMTGAAKGTVLKLLGGGWRGVRGLSEQASSSSFRAATLQCDEIWSFVGSQGAERPGRRSAANGKGDVVDVDGDLCRHEDSYRAGTSAGRDADAAATFMEDLASRLAARVQLTTDGHIAYLSRGGGCVRVERRGLRDASQTLRATDAPRDTRRYSAPESGRHGDARGSWDSPTRRSSRRRYVESAQSHDADAEPAA